MSDLVERLREEPYPYERRHGLGITAMQVWHKTACEAADALERKDAEIARLRAERDAISEALIIQFIDEYGDTREEAKSEVERIAREALQDKDQAGDKYENQTE